MYGVVKSVDRTLEIVDGTHEIPQYDIWSASYRLFQSMKFWPKDTIFVSVVDPGVGTKRKACVARTADGYYVVTPDNGSLTHLMKHVGITAVREIDETVNRLRDMNTEGTSVFHGRDLFGYCAAKLASGLIDFEGVGPEYPLSEIRLLPDSEPHYNEGAVHGYLEIGDPNFGNLWSNIPLSLFETAGFQYGDKLLTKVWQGDQLKLEQVLPFHPSFGFVAKNELVIYNNELLHIALAVNQGSLIDQHGLFWGAEWQISFEKVVSQCL